jgi:hypothetical protein
MELSLIRLQQSALHHKPFTVVSALHCLCMLFSFAVSLFVCSLSVSLPCSCAWMR